MNNNAVDTETKTRINVDLSGVPETLLWPLWNRAAEQNVENPLVDDPLAAELVDRIDYDFMASFGKPNAGHPIRARLIDDAIRGWLGENPSGTVISLGEGLDSQFWRVDNGSVKWISVDLRESISLRKRLLPDEERMTMVSCSALDSSWMDKAPSEEPVFIAMGGLLMFFREEDVAALLHQIGERFAQKSEIYFDVIPPWMSRKSSSEKGMNVTGTYRAPAMPWGIRYDEVDRIGLFHPALQIKKQLTYADPFPERMRPWCYLARVSWLRNRLAPSLVHLEIV